MPSNKDKQILLLKLIILLVETGIGCLPQLKQTMKATKSPKSLWMAGSFALALFLSATTAQAYVYATDIKLNGSLYSITNSPASPAIISYRLNQAATAGVTVAILQSGIMVATINGGTAMGLNAVKWGGTNNSGIVAGPGTYSISVTAGAGGFPIWTQISV